MNRRIKKIAKDISLRLMLPLDVVEKIINSQFKTIKDTMQEADRDDIETFKTVQVMHLGKFAVREYKLKYFKEQADAARDKDTDRCVQGEDKENT